jgi:hypothetical protein
MTSPTGPRFQRETVLPLMDRAPGEMGRAVAEIGSDYASSAQRLYSHLEALADGITDGLRRIEAGREVGFVYLHPTQMGELSALLGEYEASRTAWGRIVKALPPAADGAR